MHLGAADLIRMWVRKRIEITPKDLLRGLCGCFAPGDYDQACDDVGRVWDVDDALVCLSVRSGFDLLLQSADWESDAEIIMSGLTIPDMTRIVEANGLKAVGVDIDLDTMQPDVEQIRQSITPRTRAIVVAHLLGGICDIAPLVTIAREHNLLLIEDCAQAYVGTHYQGDERADVSMFSFGPIKTNTSLAGAVFRVRNPQLRERMDRYHQYWSYQSRFTFAKRIIKYAFVKVISTRPLCGGFYQFLKLFGKNHDGVARSMARGFAGPGFFERIRRQPSLPLLKLLRHKLAQFDPAEADRRRQLGQRFCQQVGDQVYVLGAHMSRQTWWVLPILVEDPDAIVPKLWDAGFDASNSCSLHSLVQDEDSVATTILKHIVFLPLHSAMPKSELDRLAKTVLEAKPLKPILPESFEPHVLNGQSVGGSVVDSRPLVKPSPMVSS